VRERWSWKGWRSNLRRVHWREIALDSLLAVTVVALISLIIAEIDNIGHVSNISNLYIIGIAVLSARRGVYPALLASVLAFLVYDWFFIPPVHMFTVSDPSEYVALITLLVTSIVIGQLLAAVRRRAEEARRQQVQTEVLYEVSRAALSRSEVSEVYGLALRLLSEAVGLAWSRVLLRQDTHLTEVASYGSLPERPDVPFLPQRVVEEAEPFGVWRQPQNNVRIVSELNIGAGQAHSPEGGSLSEVHIPLIIESHAEGVLVVGAKLTREPLTAEEARFLQAFSNQLASAIQRDRLSDQRARARALEESDRLKSALVSSVSHELKTPLTAIKASASALLEDDSHTDPEVRRELVEAINRETDRLTRLVSNLLDMSRLEAGGLTPQLEWVSIADVVSDVLDRIEPILGDRPVAVTIPDDIPRTPLDFVMISQVLMNLLDNATRYSPKDARITISAEVVRDQLRVTVFNEGSHIPRGDLERMFDKFYRGSKDSGGTGLGLAIARGMVEAHHGRIWAENVGRRGVAFKFTLPSPNEEAGSIAAPATFGGAR
jgi:two-component system sensor histidine kinase KdpD